MMTWDFFTGTLLAAGNEGRFLDGIKWVTVQLASGVEGAAGLIIGLAAIEATVRALALFVRHLTRAAGQGGADNRIQVEGYTLAQSEESIRLSLGRWLAVALEFELAADILRTAVAPTWNEIGQLAAIAALRTLLNYFLQKEIDSAARRNQSVPPPPTGDAAITPRPT